MKKLLVLLMVSMFVLGGVAHAGSWDMADGRVDMDLGTYEDELGGIENKGYELRGMTPIPTYDPDKYKLSR